MLRLFNRWGHSLPGLRIAEPAGYILIGVVLLLVCAVLIVLKRHRRTWLLLALVAFAQWTFFCSLTILELWWKTNFSGFWDKWTDQLVFKTVPTYWIVGCLFISTIYAARRLYGGWSDATAGGFPVIGAAKADRSGQSQASRDE